MKTGFSNIDNLLGGFKPGELITMSALPEIGGTSFALSVAANVLKQPATKVLYVSLEVNSQQLAERFFKTMGDEIWDFAERFFIEDDTKISSQEIIEKITTIKPEIVIIDKLEFFYCQNIDNQKNSIELWLLELKCIAVRMGVPVLALSQLPSECAGKLVLKPENFPYASEFVDELGFLERITDSKSEFYNVVTAYFYPKTIAYGSSYVGMLKFKDGRIFKSAR